MGQFSLEKTVNLVLSIVEKKKLLRAIERAKEALTKDRTLSDEDALILLRNDLGSVLEEIEKKHNRETPTPTPIRKRYLS